MYEHLVSFRFNSPLPSEKERELLAALHAFKGQIPGVVELTAGMNMTEETGNIHGYTLGLRVTFEDREALRQYGPHPVHQQFVKMLDGILDKVVVLDYPVNR